MSRSSCGHFLHLELWEKVGVHTKCGHFLHLELFSAQVNRNYGCYGCSTSDRYPISLEQVGTLCFRFHFRFGLSFYSMFGLSGYSLSHFSLCLALRFGLS